MKTKLRKFGAGLMAAALAFAGAGAVQAETVAKIGETSYETLAAAFEAVKSGDTLEIVKAGEYTVDSLPSDGYTLKATVDGVKFKGPNKDIAYVAWNKSVGIVLSNVTWNVGTAGYQYWGKVQSYDCKFIGLLCCGLGAYFENCQFEQDAKDYHVWAYGACSFKDCTFTNPKTGKFINVYNEGSTVYSVSFVGCKFINAADEANKSALNVKATCGSTGLGSVVTAENCTVEGPFPAASTSASLIVFNGVVQLDDINASVPNTVSITQDGKVLYADNEVVGPEVAIEKPTKEEVAAKTEGEATPEQKTVKAEEVVAVIAEAVEKEALEVAKSGLSAAGKTADGKLADPLVTALKDAAGEKEDEITNETKVKKTIDVVFKGMTVEAGEKVTTTKIAYDVTPKATATLANGTEVKAAIPNGTFGKINFRMPLTADFAGRWLKVSRTDNGTDFVDVGLYQAQKDGEVDFVQVDGDHFTTYVNEISDVTPVASINGKGYTTLSDAVAAAEDGQTIKVIKPDTYKLPDFTAQVTLESVEGVSYNCKDNLKVVGGSQQVCGITKPVTFKGGSFDFGENIYRGFIFKTGSLQDIAAKVTFDGAYIKGIICGHGDLEFKNCTIEQISSGQYPIRSWGSPTITVTGCTFLTGGRAILVYREGYPNSQQTVNVSGCHFLTKEGQTIDSKGAVQVNPADKGTAHYDVTISDCDASEAYTGLWDIKLVSGKGPDALILVDGDQVYPEPVAQIGTKKYSTLAQALAAVQNNETVKVLKSGNVVTEYAKQIGEEGYGEGAGQNRLVFGTDPTKPFTLDLNGLTLSGRLNVTSGVMMVANGTLRASSQAVNIFGTMDIDYTNKVWTSVTIAADATVRSDTYGLCVFAGDPNRSAYPLGFGEVFNVYGKVCSPYYAAYVSGNVGNCQNVYVKDHGYAEKQCTPWIASVLGMTYGEAMRNFGPKVNIYDGAVMESTEESGQGIAIQGCATVNVYGGSITGHEAIGVKGGFLNVYGGKLTATGAKWDPVTAVHSGTEQSGAAIAVTTYYQTQNPIAVNVTGGTMQSLNNSAMLVAHSYKSGVPTKASLGVSVAVAGGTFTGGEKQSAIFVEKMLAGEEGKYPEYFITAQLGEDGKETGYPLCNSSIAAAYIAPGYVEKDNKDGTWTVTAGSREIKTDTEHATVEVTIAEGKEIDPEEAKQAAQEVKENIAEAMKDPEVAEVSGTGIKEAAYDEEGGEQVLKPVVVEALQKQAVEDFKAANPGAGEAVVEAYKQAVNQAITKKSKAETTVEVKLDEVKVTVDRPEAEGQTLETTLTSAKFDVKPIFKTTVTIDGKTTITETTLPEGTVLESPVTFPLWLNSDFLGQVVTVKHEHQSEVIGTTKEVIKTSEGGRKYVEQTWDRFSIGLVEAMDITGMSCWANGEVYDKVADALAAGLPENAEIFLLADCPETDLALGVNRKIILNDHAFTGSVAAGDGNEMVRGADGTIYIAPAAVDVPVGGGKYVKVRGYTEFPAGVDKGEYLAAKPDGASLARWQTFVMGVPEATKLVPQIVGAATEGISTVVIKADFPALNPPAKCGMKTAFRLMQAIGSQTGYSQYGVDSDVPHFQVDVKEIAEKTFWKIQTSFKSTEVEEAEVED